MTTHELGRLLLQTVDLPLGAYFDSEDLKILCGDQQGQRPVGVLKAKARVISVNGQAAEAGKS